MRLRRSALVLAVLAAPAIADAQELGRPGGEVERILQARGESRYDHRIHEALAVIDDIDGDGMRDFVTGAPHSGHQGYGAVHAMRSSDGKRLWAKYSQVWAGYFGETLATYPDWDGDGFGELLVGAPERFSSVSLHRMQDGGTIWKYEHVGSRRRFGHAIATIDDVNGDGRLDVAVGAPLSGPDEQGGVVVLSGYDGIPIYQVAGQIARNEFGRSVTAISDLDGDGVGDWAAGAPDFIYQGNLYGRVSAHSGVDGSLIWEVADPEPRTGLGWAMDGSQDFNRDGYRDILVSAPKHNDDRGRVYVLDGRDGSPIHVIDSDSPESRSYLGFGLCASADIDGDHWPDFAVGEHQWDDDSPNWFDGGRAAVHSGRDGSLLWESFSEVSRPDGLGRELACGDIDGDGLDELVATVPLVPYGCYGYCGEAWILKFRAYLYSDADSLSQANGGVLSLQLRFPVDAAGDEYRVLYSGHGRGPSTVGALEVALTHDGVFASSYAGRYPPFASGMAGTLDGNAEAHAHLAPGPGVLPPRLVGRTLWLAAISRPAGQDWHYASVSRPLLIEP